MPYLKAIVCLANSFKTEGSCIAGKEVLADGYGGWLRPVSARPTAEVWPSECKYVDSQLPKLLDIMEVPLLGVANPPTHQTENHVIDTSRPWRKVGELPISELHRLGDQPASLWINNARTFAGVNNCISLEEAASLQGSLLLIRPEPFVVTVGSKIWDKKTTRTYRADFNYRTVHYRFQLTDPIVTGIYQAKDEGDYPLDDLDICVSLTEPWEKDNNRCHKPAAAVFNNRSLQ